MPTYTAPTTRTTGELISAAIFNTDLVENIKYFKDAPAFAGNVTVAGTLGVTGATTLSSTVATGALTVTGAATYTTSLTSTTALATPAALTATQATAFASTVSGSAIMGFGTTNDVSLMNRAGTVVLGVGPNTTAVNMAGTLAVGGVLTVSGLGTHTFSAAGTNIIRLRGGTSAGYGIDLTSPSGGSSPHIDTIGSGTDLIFDINSVEKMRLTNGGSFLINTTTVLAKLVLSAPMQTIDGFSLIDTSTAFSPNIYIHFYNSSLGVAGSIAHPSASAVTFNTSSDQRLKRDLGLARDVSALRALRIHDFSWASDGVIDRNVFAQEAYAVMPRGITKGDDDPITVTKTWMVEKAAYVPDLIVGWQQHDATITQLAARIAALESQDN